MARTSLTLSIEINKLQIVLAERIEEASLQKKKFKNKLTGELVSFQKKTPSITQDKDTASFMRYWLHRQVKMNCFGEVRYDELADF